MGPLDILKSLNGLDYFPNTNEFASNNARKIVFFRYKIYVTLRLFVSKD